jgi:RNA polymerase sigma factor (sigma-70 family)
MQALSDPTTRSGMSLEPGPETLSPSRERLGSPAELELARAARAGDGAARSRLIHSCKPLVAAVARRYYSRYMEQEDLFQEGIIGLCEAIDNFDADRGIGFGTYATYWIRRRVLAALERNAHLIRLPGDVLYASRRSAGEEANAQQLQDGRVSSRRLRDARACLAEPLSLNSLAASEGDREGPEPADSLTPEPETALL